MFINGVGNDLKIAIDNIIEAIITIKNDLEDVKNKLNLDSLNEESDFD